mgnify:CR=1 FL=1
MDTITIFSAKISKDLIQKKFELVDINPNNEMSIKTVFYFRDTEDLRVYLKNEYGIKINSEGVKNG